MSTIEKILERIPYGDGRLRRQIVSGLIFVFALVVHHAVVSDAPTAQLSVGGIKLDRSMLLSTQLLVVAGVFVFAIGGIIDTMTRSFISQGASIATNSLRWLFELKRNRAPTLNGPETAEDKWKHRLWITLIIVVTVAFWPLAILCGTILSSVGVRWLYRVGLKENRDGQLSTQAMRLLDSDVLGEQIRDGLDQPHGLSFEAAWRQLLEKVRPADQTWANHLESRIHDVASFVSSTMIALLISLFLHLGGGWLTGLATYGLLCFLSYLMFGTVSMACRSVVGLLEYVAMVDSKK